MTDHHTTTPITTLLLHRLERELDEAWTALQHFQAEHPHEDVDDEADAVCAVIHRIEKVEPRTLGDVRIWAKALDRYYDYNCDAVVFDLLQVLKDLPQRLWDERIG